MKDLGEHLFSLFGVLVSPINGWQKCQCGHLRSVHGSSAACLFQSGPERRFCSCERFARRRNAVAESIKASLRTPDSTQPIIAYRAWDIEGSHSEPVLAPIASSKPWAVRKAEAANVDEHGYYAFKDEAALQQVLSGSRTRVLGRVAIWGRIKEHQHGYRAEYAYPQVLYTHPALDEQRIKAVAERYGIETCPMPDHLRSTFDAQFEMMSMQQREWAWRSFIESERVREIRKDIKQSSDYTEQQRQIAEQQRMQYGWRAL